MIKNRKKLAVKLLTVCLGIVMLTITIVLGANSSLLKMIPTTQASPIETPNLNLSDQQKAATQTILRNANEQIRQLKANTQIKRTPFARNQAQQQVQELFKQIEEIRTDALGKIRNQMNPTQQESFDQLVSKIKEANKNRSDMLKSLNLTQQQKMQIIRSIEKSKTQIWDILGNNTFLANQKMEQLKKIRQDIASNIREQLTPDQQTKFDAWQQQQNPIL